VHSRTRMHDVVRRRFLIRPLIEPPAVQTHTKCNSTLGEEYSVCVNVRGSWGGGSYTHAHIYRDTTERGKVTVPATSYHVKTIWAFDLRV
jgi:hypothetical protein